jgi:hypothetical protein
MPYTGMPLQMMPIGRQMFEDPRTVPQQGGVPAQIDDLKAVVSDLTKQVAELQPLKDDVKNIKEDISSIKTEIEAIKNSQTTTPGGQQVQQRLSFDGANWTVVVTLYDRPGGGGTPYYIPDRVVYLWEENNQNDKLVGITDYKGTIVFHVTRGKQYIAQFKGDDKYRPIYSKSTIDTNIYSKNDYASLTTYSY